MTTARDCDVCRAPIPTDHDSYVLTRVRLHGSRSAYVIKGLARACSLLCLHALATDPGEYIRENS